VNGFILRPSKLDEIEDGYLGLSSFQRDAMQISKVDQFDITVARIKEANPLNQVDILVDLIFKDDSVELDQTGSVKIAETDIDAAVKKLFKGKFINTREQFPLTLMDGNVIVKISVGALEPLKEDIKTMSYGVIENETEIICKPSKAAMKSIKILSNKF
jgi:hypothetical protein